jgi:dihydroxyacetone kinase-like protein
MLTKDKVIEWLYEVGDVMVENKEFLTKLDAEIGDADHGINMDRDFKKVLEQLSMLKNSDIGNILKNTGLALISSVGGASGPLYGTLFIRAGTKASGKNELHISELVAVLQDGLYGVIDRGRAQSDDKTMVDALLPVIEALRKATEKGKTQREALTKAVMAAEQGVKATISMQGRKGRASYLGERSIGHQDPGATSSYLILKALQDVLS